MKILFAPLGLTLALALGGCDKSKTAAPAPVPAAKADEAKPTEAKPGDSNAGAPKADEAKPGDAAPTTAEVGRPAPDFELKDLDGKTHKLSDYRGRTVVLEWYNPDCPFVVKQYNEGPLKTQAKDLAAKNIVWLGINSGAAGKQGAGLDRNKASVTEYGIQHPVLLDEDGKVGKAYQARNTPHMYVITPEGVLAYAGAIDNAPMGKAPESGFVNYVTDALADLAEQRPVRVPETKAYGCTVKYAD